MVAAQPPHPPLANLDAGLLERIGQESVAELGIIAVSIHEGDGEVSVIEAPVQTRPGTTKKGRAGKRPGPAIHDDLVNREFTTDRPDAVWVTEHPTVEGKIY